MTVINMSYVNEREFRRTWRQLARDVRPSDRAKITQTALEMGSHPIITEIRRLTPVDKGDLRRSAAARRLRTAGAFGGFRRAIGTTSSLAPGVLVGYFGVPIGQALAVEFGNRYRSAVAPIRQAITNQRDQFTLAFGESFGTALLRRAAVHGRASILAASRYRGNNSTRRPR